MKMCVNTSGFHSKTQSRC